SEPDAGSDLAAARTRAERRGDAYVVNGQKVWSSFAHIADFCILVTQSDPDAARYRNLTYLLVDMHAPGVEVRPLRQITGEAEFNEIFFSDVEVPVENRLGDERDGWQVATTTGGTTSSSAAGATRSRPGRRRCCATSSPSECSACRGRADGFRALGGPARAEAGGARVARRPLPARPRLGGTGRPLERAPGARLARRRRGRARVRRGGA